MVTLVEAVTALVVTGKVAEVEPAGMVTLAGADATAGLLLESETRTSLQHSGLVRITVPWDAAPPVTLAGLSVSPGSTVTTVLAVVPLREAVMVTAVAFVTGWVCTRLLVPWAPQPK